MAVRIIKGDVREKLTELPADYFDCIVTSPPYYGLRDYGTATWEGGDVACDHIEVNPQNRPGRETPGGRGGTFPHTERAYKGTCGKCGARRIDAQIGLEPTLNAFLETMVAVCQELRHVLKPSGVCFINIGDSYAATSKGSGGSGKSGLNCGPVLGDKSNAAAKFSVRNFDIGTDGLKPKDLMLVPERLGVALQADGWWVRSHIIWAKRNPIPESCIDRPTSAHETIWMLTKSARYYWDAEAVKEEREGDHEANGFRGGCYVGGRMDNAAVGDNPHQGCRPPSQSTRNLRNVWHIASQPYSGAHFATFPTELAERCIKAGSPRGGNVLDPFAGAGTTGLVADRLGRDCTLIDLNTEYAEMAMKRIKDDCPMFTEVSAE